MPIHKRDSTVITHAATEANRARLAQSFLEEVQARYTVAAQSADGLIGAYQIDVGQISAKFGPGRFATLDVAG